MADSAFGQYDYHLAKNFCHEASELMFDARQKLQAAHALFAIADEIWKPSQDAVYKLSHIVNDAAGEALDLGRLGFIR